MCQLNHWANNLSLGNSTNVDLYIILVSQFPICQIVSSAKIIWIISLFQFFTGCIYSFTQLIFTELSGKMKQIKQT